MTIKNEREFLNAVIANTITAEVIAYATEGIAKLDARNEKRKATLTKAQKENEPIAQAIIEALANGGMLGVDLATAIGQTTQKTNGVAGNLVKEGKVVKTKVKVKGKGELTHYALAPTAEVVEVAEDTATDEVVEG